RYVFAIDGNDPLADILGKIADALDLIRNPQDPDNLPKVASDWLPACNGFNRPFLDIALHGVDCRVGGDDALCRSAFARRQRLDRLGNLPLGQPAHLGDCPPELLQISVEDFGGMSGMNHVAGPIQAAGGTLSQRAFFNWSCAAPERGVNLQTKPFGVESTTREKRTFSSAFGPGAHSC